MRSSRSIATTPARPSSRKKKKRNRASPIVAELQGDAEVVLAQGAHGILQVVLRRRRHAHLVGLDRGLHLLQLFFLEVLHDLARRLDWNALLDLDHPPQRAAGG